MSKNSDWEALKEKLSKGTRLAVTVERHCPFGIFVSIPGESFQGLVQITDFKDEGRMTPQEYPAVGSIIDCVVLGFERCERASMAG